MKELIERIPRFTIPEYFSIRNLSGLLTALAVSIPSLIDYFRDGSEYRWVVLGLYFIFIFFLVIREYVLVQSPLPSSLYLGIQTIIIISLLSLPPHHEFVIILFFILSAEATTLQPNRNGYLWIIAFTFITMASLFFLGGGAAALYGFPIYAGGFIFFGAFSASAARAEAARQESQTLLQELREAHTKLQQYAAQAERLAVSEERNRLAREMHDTLGHRLTVAIVQLEGAGRLVKEDPDRAEEMVATVKEQMRAGLSELRSAVATLREPLQADLSLKSALKSLGENFQAATEIEVQMAFAHKLPDLSNEYRVAIYRAAQEALTNVQRHAQAKHVRMILTIENDEINLTLRDDGIGLPENADKLGFGLRGIEERAAQLGGRMRLEANPEGGAQICICLPIPTEESHNDA